MPLIKVTNGQALAQNGNAVPELRGATVWPVRADRARQLTPPIIDTLIHPADPSAFRRCYCDEIQLRSVGRGRGARDDQRRIR